MPVYEREAGISQSIDAVVCIPTFRRPDWLTRTLKSLEAQQVDFGFAVVVVDNDASAPVGADVARGFLTQSGLPGAVVVEPQQGNCHAINAAFGLALERFPTAQYMLMIDDDEAADPQWLARMVGAARASGADIVGGPVLREFEVPASRGVRQHSLFGSIEAASGPIPIIHGSGNCLISRRVFENLAEPRFDLRFNFLGGGDMDFFYRSRAAGFSFYWCAEAIIHEFVPKERVSARWLMQRSLRTGTINYTIDRMRNGAGPRMILKNAGSLVLGLLRAIGVLVRTGEVLPATHPILLSVGRTLASLGFSPVPYKAG